MSFWKSLFGGGSGEAGSAKTLKSVEHNGFLIEAQPYQEGGQYQVAGLITKEIGGEKKSHRFIRADRYPGAEDAADVALDKGRQIVDQQGEKIFK
jgi:hypothetical protein